MANHARIEPRAVTVIFTIHLAQIIRVGKLKQSASIFTNTLHEHEGTFCYLLISLRRKYSGQSLNAKIENFSKTVVAANTATVDLGVHLSPLIYRRAQCSAVSVYHHSNQIRKSNSGSPS